MAWLLCGGQWPLRAARRRRLGRGDALQPHQPAKRADRGHGHTGSGALLSGESSRANHADTLLVSLTQSHLSPFPKVWYYLAPGSGIWINVGKSLRTKTDRVRQPESPGCERAVTEGYDTFMLLPDNNDVADGLSRYGSAIEIVDCRGWRDHPHTAAIAFEGTCPPAEASPLRVGLRGPERPCRCDPTRSFLNCNNGDPPPEAVPFAYSGLQLSSSWANFSLTNAGEQEASETVQVRVVPPNETAAPGMRSLRAWTRVTLAPGASTDLAFQIARAKLPKEERLTLIFHSHSMALPV